MTSNKNFLLSAFIAVFALLSVNTVYAARSTYFQIKVYHFKDKVQEDVVDNYLEKAYVPQLHKMGINQVGVFKTLEEDADRRIYVFVPLASLNDVSDIDLKVFASVNEAGTAKSYIDADPKNPPYVRVETIILSGFREMTGTAVPNLTTPKAERIYELRSYEGPTEKYYYNKVKMFNDGNEVALFKRLNFNAVFYASVIAGSKMPNLMYMTTFNNKADREKHWEAFNNDPEWKALSSKPEYQNNVSHADIIFLHPADYSDF